MNSNCYLEFHINGTIFYRCLYCYYNNNYRKLLKLKAILAHELKYHPPSSPPRSPASPPFSLCSK